MIVGCDYSTKLVHLAWEITKKGTKKGWYTAEVDPNQLSILESHIRQLAKDGAVALYLEKPWTRNNMWTGMQMVRIATIVETLAKLSDIEVHLVSPSHWRSEIFGKGKYDRKTAKALSVAKATEVLGQEVDDNTADAVCIALYGAVHERGEVHA